MVLRPYLMVPEKGAFQTQSTGMNETRGRNADAPFSPYVEKGANMADYKDEGSLTSFQHRDEGPQEGTVVVYLEAHRRWRARTRRQSFSDFPDDGAPHIDANLSSAAPSFKEPTESVKALAPSLLLAGLVMMISVTLIIGLYWAFTAAILALFRFSFAHF